MSENMDIKNKEKSTTKKRKINRIIIILVCILIVFNLAGGAYFFVYTIVSKKISKMELPLDAAVAPSGKNDPVYTNWYASTAFEEMRLTTEDGIDLIGRYINAGHPTNKLAILIHGYMMDGSIMAAYGKYYHENDFDVFIADNRGHGLSDGTFVGMGWLDRLDYLQWLNLLVEKKGSATEIVIHGISMGGATVACLGGEQLPQQVKCLIVDCSYTSVYESFKYQGGKMLGVLNIPFLNIGSIISKVFAGYGFSEASPLKQVSKSVTPVFFIHGEEDTFTPTYMTNELYKAAASEKELWIVPDADHGKAFDVNPEEYFIRVEDFYSKYIN
jgi:fermentation-respiration switch protein FrsA (DUF1100 family)